jgi:transposase InsO family protein
VAWPTAKRWAERYRQHGTSRSWGNIPDGGGWRYLGLQQGLKNRNTTSGKPKSKHRNPLFRTAYVHTILDDHSRVAYAENPRRRDRGHCDRCPAAVHRRVPQTRRDRSPGALDNGSCYRSHAWRDTCAELGLHKRIRPHRPQTNGKIERFHRTLADGWAFKQFLASESACRNALPAWPHEYNHHRPHSATGNLAPITRLINVSEQYI